MKDLLLKGRPIGNIKGVLFDKDGTLSNSEEYLIRLAKDRINETLKKFKDLKVNKLKILRLKRSLNLLYGLQKNSLDPSSIMAIASREQNIISTATIFTTFGTNWSSAISLSKEIFFNADKINSDSVIQDKNKRSLLKGAKELLHELNQAGIQSALISNDTNESLKKFIQINHLEKLIQYFRGAENYPSKPDPLAVIGLCNSMRLDPSECALISDAETDLTMAKEAKIKIILGFSGGWKAPPKFNEKTFVLNHWDELKIR